jgi:hypothetical protein
MFLSILPLCSLIFGSTSSRRCALSRSCVPSSSAPISREYPATSAARIAVRRRIEGISRLAVGVLTKPTLKPAPALAFSGRGRPKRGFCRHVRNRGDGCAELQPNLDACYSITSLARMRIDCGMVRPSAFAVLRLMTSSYSAGCWIGRSAGLAPLRIFPA